MLDEFHLNVFMYIIQNNLVKSIELINMFVYLDENRDRLTRAAANKDLVVHFNRTIYGKKSVRIAGPIAWNLLHQDLKNAKSLNIFKSLYRKIYPP